MYYYNILNEREERSILKEIKQTPFKTAKHLKIFHINGTEKDVPLNALMNNGHIYEYHEGVSTNKPFINLKNKNYSARLAKEYLLKHQTFG